MAAKIGHYLNVPVGARYQKQTDGSVIKREYASRIAQSRRAQFDAEADRQRTERVRDPQAGDIVLSQGEQAEFVQWTARGGCVLAFWRCEGAVESKVEKEFEAVFGRQARSANLKMPPALSVGDTVISHGAKAEVATLLTNGGCTLFFQSTEGSYCQRHTYRFRLGKAVGSARLHRPPPLLSPPSRVAGTFAVTSEIRQLVCDHAKQVCPLSPCKRDAVKRHVGPRVIETRQVMRSCPTTPNLFELPRVNTNQVLDVVVCAGTYFIVSVVHSLPSFYGCSSRAAEEEPV